MEMENEQQDDNVEANVNNGNGNGNGNGNPNVNNEGVVEKYIGGLPDNIQGNVIDAEPTRLQEEIRIAINFIDQKLKGYVVKNAENKRRFDNNPRDNRGQQQPFKRQNVNGQNIARAYTIGNNAERKEVGHMTRDYKAAVATTAQRARVRNQTGVTCYECGRQGHYRSELSSSGRKPEPA
ncbi:hypothetical protein Tco_0595886 [Tanacetum coccineum]